MNEAYLFQGFCHYCKCVGLSPNINVYKTLAYECPVRWMYSEPNRNLILASVILNTPREVCFHLPPKKGAGLVDLGFCHRTWDLCSLLCYFCFLFLAFHGQCLKNNHLLFPHLPSSTPSSPWCFVFLFCSINLPFFLSLPPISCCLLLIFFLIALMKTWFLPGDTPSSGVTFNGSYSFSHTLWLLKCHPSFLLPLPNCCFPHLVVEMWTSLGLVQSGSVSPFSLCLIIFYQPPTHSTSCTEE